MSLSRLPDANAMYGQSARYGWIADSTTRDLAWKLEYKSRRYHEVYRTKRGDHKHKGAWEDCATLACSEDRAFLELAAAPRIPSKEGTR